MSLTYTQLTETCNNLDNELSDCYSENLVLIDKINNLTEMNHELLTENTSLYTAINTQNIKLKRKELH